MFALRFALRFALLAAPALPVQARPLQCVAAPGSSATVLSTRLADLRASDGLYRQVVAWKGPPAACTGSAGAGESDGIGRLLLSWPDGSRFAASSMLPETTIVEYSNPEGLAHADEIPATLRTYAAALGLHVDWTAPHRTVDKRMQVVEYEDPGMNGIVRFIYSPGNRLTAVTLSIAL